MGDAVETGCERVRDRTVDGCSHAPMNTTRPAQINRPPIDPLARSFMRGCESRWSLILGLGG